MKRTLSIRVLAMCLVVLSLIVFSGFDFTCKSRALATSTGWVKKDSTWYYYKTDGSMAKGWLLLSGKYYYLSKTTGAMFTGWHKISKVYYYFNKSGVMQKGWQTIGGKKYYLASSGKMLTGWQTINGKKYYFASSGAMKTGWLLLSGSYYYLDKTTGERLTGWQKIGKVYYYFSKSTGKMLTGLRTIGGKKYYLASSGKMLTGWQEIDGKMYYFASSGAMKTGFNTIDGKTFYFDPTTGAMLKGLVDIGECKYYFDDSGVMQTGWQEIEGTSYYFDPDNDGKWDPDAKKESEGPTEPDSYDFSEKNIGDVIEFGSWEQDNNSDNGKESIEWIVIGKDTGRLLVISKYALTGSTYNADYEAVTWDGCTLRTWLNGTSFLHAAFTIKQKNMILTTTVTADQNTSYPKVPYGTATSDKIFLLSGEEYDHYLASSEARFCTATASAKAEGVSTSDYKNPNGYCDWWLRTPGMQEEYASTGTYAGKVNADGDMVDYSANGVRPAMWINLKG